MEGKTSTGFKYVIDEDARDDMELFDALTDVDEGKTSGIRRAITMLLGEDQRKALYDHCRGKSGRVSASKVFAEFSEILENSGNDVKNS